MVEGSGKVACLESNHFVGSRYFFLKSDLNWPFFTHSNTLESYVINLRGQENLKTQKEMREIVITIYLCTCTF